MSRTVGVRLAFRPELSDRDRIAAIAGNLVAFRLQALRIERLSWILCESNADSRDDSLRLYVTPAAGTLALRLGADLERVVREVAVLRIDELESDYRERVLAGAIPAVVSDCADQREDWPDPDLWMLGGFHLPG